MSASYQENAYAWLKRQGLAPKYERAGVYCIKIDGEIVYIGKSDNMLRRIAQHHVGIQKESEKKYRLLAEARRKGRRISYDVLYYATRCGLALDDELGSKEGEYIRRYTPILNTQIPREDNWRKYTARRVDAQIVRENYIEKGRKML